MSLSRDVIEQKQGPNQIVRIRSDSETHLDDLFKAVMQPKSSQVHQSVPMRLRNLPPSFFQQPERGSKSASHSRESSTDNTFSNASPQPVTPNNNSNTASGNSKQNSNNNATVSSPPPQHSSGLPINHPRAHSSPASLQQTYNASQHQHLRQQSYDITDSIPLPPGWEKAKTATGQTYFLNHTTQTTTWEDPRKKLSAGSLSNSSGVTSLSPSSTSPASSLVNLQNLSSLPEGWEQASTAEGEVYFINHKTQTTSWYDPRIPTGHIKHCRELYESGGLHSLDLLAIHLQQPPLVPILGCGSASTQLQNSLSLASQQTQSTSVTSSLGTISLPSLTTQTLQQQQQKLRLQRLQIERERLRLRQQEILRETACFGNPLLNDMMRQTLREDSSLPTSPNSSADQTSSTNIDPFLGGDSDFHSRQESGDSGLGLSTNYSLPNTPEDYLMGMEEGSSADDVLLDIAELNLEPIPGTSLDIVPENMDSEDLVPSLQEELNADILSDVEALLNSNKESVMKWL